ncbi:hypothetical protein UT300005_05790 [Clostridium sp. CTA-5]
MENDNVFNEIKRIMDQNTSEHIGNAMFTNGLTLATLTSSGLKLDNFKYEINDYLILDYLKLNLVTETAGDPSHSHSVNFPNFKAGDRVLVAQIGNECIVVGRVVANG